MISEILFILVLISVIVFFGAGCFLAGYLSCKYNLLNKEKPKGKWIWDLRMGLHKCSSCGKFCDFDYLYCPNCGAEMSGGSEDE